MHVCDIWIHIQQRSHVPTALKSEITRMDLKAEREKEFYLYIEKKRRMKNKCCENTRIYIIVCVCIYIYIRTCDKFICIRQNVRSYSAIADSRSQKRVINYSFRGKRITFCVKL